MGDTLVDILAERVQHPNRARRQEFEQQLLKMHPEKSVDVKPVSPLDNFVIDQPRGSYRSFGKDYPIPGITYPTDYGYIPGYLGQDDADLDLFRGSGNLHGRFDVERKDARG